MGFYSTVPVVRPKLPFAITSKGPATALVGNVQPTQRRAVLNSVSPNTTNPTSASVVLDGILPPRPGYTLPQGFGPVYAAGTHATGPFYNDPVSLEGGSYVLVDTVSQTVISLLQGVSTTAPTTEAAYMASLQQHTGGVSITGQPLAGTTDDVNAGIVNYLNNTNLSGNPDPNTPPILVPGSLSPITYPTILSASFDAEIANFQLAQPLGCNAWLVEIRLYAIPSNGAVWNKNQAINKGDIAANLTGTYGAIWGGETSGQAYDLWVAYVDVRGIPSAALYLATTETNPAIFGQPALAPTTAPLISNIGVGVSVGEGNGTFDYKVPFTLDANSTTANTTVTEIELLAITSTDDSSNGPENAAVVNYLIPNESGNYVGVWPTLGAANAYDLYLRNRGGKGDVSAITFVQTTSAPQISNGALAPNPDTELNPVIAAGSVSAITYPLILSGSYDAELSWTLTYPSGYASWLREIRLYAFPTNGGQPFPVSRAKSYDIEVTDNGQYSAIWFGLTAGQAYDLWVAYIDTQANTSQPAFLGTTNGHPALTGVLPLSPTTPPVVTNVVVGSPIGEGNGTFDQPVEFTLDVNSTTANKTLTEIELLSVVTGQDITNLAVVSKMVPNQSGTYYQVWPTLGAGNSYDLYVQNQGGLGDVSGYSFVATTGVVPLSVGSAQSAQMPANFLNNGPTISFAQFLSQVVDGSTGYDQNFEFALGDFPANNQPNWFAGVGIWVRTHGQTAESAYHVDYANPSSVAFLDAIDNIAAGKSIDIGMSYLDQAGYSSAIVWPPALSGSQGVQANAPQTMAGISNTNFISDSNMDYTAGNGGSAYWTYAGFDPTRFHVSSTTEGFPNAHFLACNANGGAAVGAVCAYSTLINLVAGYSYTFTCVGNLDESQNGVAYIGIVSAENKAANLNTPTTVYASASLPKRGNPPIQVTPVTYACTSTGQYAFAMWANAITGSAAWLAPQLEFGNSFSGYKPGAAVSVENTIAYSAHSAEVTSTIQQNTGGIDFAQATHTNKNLDNIASTATYSKTSTSPALGPNLLDNYNFAALADPAVSTDFIFHSWQNMGVVGGGTFNGPQNYVGPCVTIAGVPAPAGSSGIYCLEIFNTPGSVIGANTTNYAAVGSAPVACIEGEVITGFAVTELYYNTPPSTYGLNPDNAVYVRYYNASMEYVGDAAGVALPASGGLQTTQLPQVTVPSGAAFVQLWFLIGVSNLTGTPITIPANEQINIVQICATSLERVTNLSTNVNSNLPHTSNSTSVLSVIASNGTYNASQAFNQLPHASNSASVLSVIASNGTYNASQAFNELPFGSQSGAVTDVIQSGGTFNPAAAWQVAGANLPYANADTSTQNAIEATYGTLSAAAFIVGTTPQSGSANQTNIEIQTNPLGTWVVTISWSLSGTNWETNIVPVTGGGVGFTTSTGIAEGTQSSMSCQAFVRVAGGTSYTFGLKGAYGGAGTGIQYAGTVNVQAFRVS